MLSVAVRVPLVDTFQLYLNCWSACALVIVPMSCVISFDSLIIHDFDPCAVTLCHFVNWFGLVGGMLPCCRCHALRTLATTRAKTCFFHNSVGQVCLVIPPALVMEKRLNHSFPDTIAGPTTVVY